MKKYLFIILSLIAFSVNAQSWNEPRTTTIDRKPALPLDSLFCIKSNNRNDAMKGLGVLYPVTDVNGNTFNVDDASSTAYFDNTTHDIKVGINTNAPSVALDVVGNANISGELDVLALVNFTTHGNIYLGDPTQPSIKISGEDGDNIILINNLPVFADEAAASSLPTNAIYKTATGELRIKL